MKTYVVELWVSHCYGGWSQVGKKTIHLPFVPFLGLRMDLGIKGTETDELVVELSNHEYCNTTIMWEHQSNKFIVDVRERLPRDVRDDVLDGNLIDYLAVGFEIVRDDTETIKRLAQRGMVT